MYAAIDQNQARLNKLYLTENEICSEIQEYFKVPLTFSSGALEGSKLTEQEVEELLTKGLPAGRAADWDHYEAMGHAGAYQYIFSIDKCALLGEECIKTLHRLLYSLVDEKLGGAEQGGEYRQSRVRITGAKYVPPAPADISARMKDFTDWLRQYENTLHPVGFAARAHQGLISIHPFMDGNRRVARLLMNLCLVRKGYPPAVILPAMSREYNAFLENCCVDDGDFSNFLVARVEESQTLLFESKHHFNQE